MCYHAADSEEPEFVFKHLMKDILLVLFTLYVLDTTEGAPLLIGWFKTRKCSPRPVVKWPIRMSCGPLIWPSNVSMFFRGRTEFSRVEKHTEAWRPDCIVCYRCMCSIRLRFNAKLNPVLSLIWWRLWKAKR